MCEALSSLSLSLSSVPQLFSPLKWCQARASSADVCFFPLWPAFADCARDRTFSIPFACRALSRQMNHCMMGHATQAEHDRAREEWFAGRMERARERERKERDGA